MSKIVALGSVSEATKAAFYSGTVLDGVKQQHPEEEGTWVYMKRFDGAQVDFAPVN